jgi:hypothetical protein
LCATLPTVAAAPAPLPDLYLLILNTRLIYVVY